VAAAFDWYQATVRGAAVDDVLEGLLAGADGASLRHDRGRHGFAHSTAVYGPSGPVAHVWHGGTHAYPHVVLSGESTQAGVEVIRAKFPDHSVTRADARVDFADAGAFERIMPVMLTAAEANRVKVGCAGDWALTMQARTLYLGSPSSACRQRLYDKAAELRAKFAADPVRLAEVPDNLARLEAQVRPQTKDARERFASIEPLEVMGSSTWLRQVWKGVAGLDLEPVQVGKVWRQTDDDRAYAYLLAQYGGLLRRRQLDHGSWAALGAQIGYDLAERDRVKRKG
jgi:hypothetical protein